MLHAGLPDGFFSNQKSQFGQIFEGHRWLGKLLIYFMVIWNILRTFVIFYEHLWYFSNICDILRTSVIFYDHLVDFVFSWYVFSGLGIMCQEKSGNPGHMAVGYSILYLIIPCEVSPVGQKTFSVQGVRGGSQFTLLLHGLPVVGQEEEPVGWNEISWRIFRFTGKKSILAPYIEANSRQNLWSSPKFQGLIPVP
jgi:hypothetical protein